MFIPRSALKVLAASLVVALIGVAVYSLRIRKTDAQRGTALLVEAFGKRRLIEPRLSGGFKGGEFRFAPGDVSDIETQKLDRASRLIMNAVEGGGALEQLSYARLLLSQGERLPEAQKYLKRALVALPESAEAHNDLGVCLNQQGNIEDAIDEFEVALKLKPDLSEALFNRGICYERLMMRGAASADYGRLLEIEPEPSWRNEIKRRQERTSAAVTPQQKEAEIVTAFDKSLADDDLDEAKRLADSNCEIIIKHVEYDCAVDYLQAEVSNNAGEAKRALFELNLIGNHLLETRADACIVDLAAHLSKLSEAERVTELQLINEYKQEIKNTTRSVEASQAAFERLAGRFQQSGNDIFQYSSIFYIAIRQYSAGHLAASINFAKQSLSAVDRHNWPIHRASLLSQLAIAHARLGRDAVALEYCEEALRASKDLLMVQAKALQYMSIAYDHLGDSEKRLASLVKSTRMYMASVPSLREIANNYLDMCETYQARGNHRLAMLCGSSSLEFSELIKDNSRAAQASALTAVEYERLNESEKAEEFLGLGRKYLDKLEKEKQGLPRYVIESFAAQIAEHRGDFQGAVMRYGEAESALAKVEDRILPLRLLRARAEAYEKAGEFDKARSDLKQAIARIEEYFENISAGADRSSFLDASQGVFDQLIALDVRAFHRYEEAFNLSEQSRARTLLDDFSARESSTSGRMKPMELAAVQRSLPAGLRLLTYAVTRDRTFLFLVTKEGLEVEQSAATTEILDRLVPEYVSSLKQIAPIGEVNEKAKELYNILIAPVEKKIRDGKTLCIAPDKTLHMLPFAALVDQTDRYLMQSYGLTYTPSATALAVCIGEGAAKPQAADEAILTVGNPDFSRVRFPQLEDLPESEREAIDSAAVYSRRTILNGRQATEQAVKSALTDCDVAHFAVHCLVQEKSPWLAALVLTGKGVEADRGGADSDVGASPVDGMLRLQEIYGLNLRRTRLVVLSACQSGLGRYYKGEGMVSLVRPFLALRVPTVVASLWSVDSRATSALMIDFHAERKRAIGSSSEALRAAQIRMMNNDAYKHPYYWAPFIAVGSNN